MDRDMKPRIAATADEVAACLAIRRRVFVVEQGIPEELDDDGLDDRALHVVVGDGDRVVATGRLIVDGDTGVLARIAVVPSHRGRGLGGRVVRRLEALAREHGARRVSLHPHQYLEAFYQRLGYHTVGGTSVVGEHVLITMVKDLVDHT